MRFVTFVKSNAKALLTLRIKSPLRSAEGTTRDLPANPVLVFAHIFTNTAYCARSQHAFYVDNILTRSDISLRNGRVYPLLPPPRPPFSRRRLCICGGSYHISDDTAAAVFG